MKRLIYLLLPLVGGLAACADSGSEAQRAAQGGRMEPSTPRAGGVGAAGLASAGTWNESGLPTAKIPLCQGLTIVTAISQPQGDFESIKTVAAVDRGEVTLRYSAEVPARGFVKAQRTVRLEDLERASSYVQHFGPELPRVIPGTTALGTSREVLRALKEDGEAELSVLMQLSGSVSLDRSARPNLYERLQVTRLQRVGRAPVLVPLMVNDAPVELPAVHARAIIAGDTAEFFFLDDPHNPLALRWRIPPQASAGLDALPGDVQEVANLAKIFGLAVEGARAKGFDELRVVKLSHRCGDTEAAAGESGALERSLAETGRAEVYDIFFAFNSAEIREESEPRLLELAELLRRQPEWKLSVEGHTDDIGSGSANRELSLRRAAAVKSTLVNGYGIDAARLSAVGHGASRPRDSNETLEGRARNRRVELARQ